MTMGAPRSFGAQLKALREAAGFTQEELATIAGLSVHAVSALERGERRRPHVETVRALSAALDLTGAARDALVRSARAPSQQAAVDELSLDSLPLGPTALIGRDADVHTLRQWLADSTARLITLIGPGGVGKTRLALEVAREIAEEGSTRVVFVSLAPIQDPAFVPSAVAEALGLVDVTAVDLPKSARAACADRPTLLVLDNFEQILAAAPLVADLLTSVASLRVLVTSRAPLRVRGEREYAIGPLELEAGSEAMPPADLARAPAVRLFLERVREVQPDFRLTSANGPTVTAICRRLDALPLALELAAPWIKVLTVENLLRRLTHDVLFSTVGPRDLPERQQTTSATVAWSYQLLDHDEQRAFRRFGALPGPFPIDAAEEALAGHEGASSGTGAIRAAAGLMDKSLLLRAETSVVTARSLYYMLDTVRAYAVRELTESGERDEAMEGLVRYTLGEAALAREELFGPRQVEWLERVRDDLESYRAAMTWLIEHGRAIEASEIASGLTMFWTIRGFAAEGIRWVEEILQLSGIPPANESRVLHGAALMYYTRGELVPARLAIERARACAHSSGDIGLVALAANLSGHIELGVGEVKAARDQFTRSVEAFQALAISWGAGNSLTGLAAVALATGDPPAAERLIEEALSTLQHGAPLFLSLALYVRAVLAVRSGNGDQAIAVMRESLTHIRQLQDKFAFVYALVPLAAAAALKGDDGWAARILGARANATERTGVKVIDTSLDDLKELAECAVRARLGPERWTLAYAAGRRSSIDGLLKDIDAGQRNGTPDESVV